MENSEDLPDLPLAEADQYIRDQIEHHRGEMARWRKVRGRRIAAERETGRGVNDIADELGVTRDMVQRLLRAGRES